MGSEENERERKKRKAIRFFSSLKSSSLPSLRASLDLNNFLFSHSELSRSLLSLSLSLSPLHSHTHTHTNARSESLTLRDLKNCSVYILDHSSEVEATNCSDCQLFVGPVDGAAIFDSCSGCTVAVASQQFQARGCSDVEFGVYCATAPTVRSCKGVRVGCWVSSFFLLLFSFFLSSSFNFRLSLSLSTPFFLTKKKKLGRSLPGPHAALRRGQPRPGVQPVAQGPRRHPG